MQVSFYITKQMSSAVLAFKCAPFSKLLFFFFHFTSDHLTNYLIIKLLWDHAPF